MGYFVCHEGPLNCKIFFLIVRVDEQSLQVKMVEILNL